MSGGGHQTKKGEPLTLEKLTARPSESPHPSEERQGHMTTVARPRTPIQHYAYYGDFYGTAELLNGSGYLFREDGHRQAALISYKDPELVLLGLVEMADTQHEVDMLVGGYAAVACGREEGRQ